MKAYCSNSSSNTALIMNLRPIFSSWPPGEKELDSERMIIPKALGHSLEILLYATEKKTLPHERFIRSISQDLIYACSNKNVEIERWAKRNIGSRRLITWIKYLGNCISYHEVNLVKTAIAE